MTLTASLTRVDYAGDGTTTNFTVPFIFFGPDEVAVYSATASTITTLVRGVNYSVLGGNGATGTVVATVAPAGGTTWSIVRATTPTQQVGFLTGDPFPAQTLERALDRLTAMMQELSARMDRTVRLSPGEQTTTLELPLPANRANKFLSFDGAGTPVATSLATSAVPVSAPMLPVVSAANLIAARAALGGRRMVDVVADFGADPSAVANSSTAIQNAINSLALGIVYFPPGVYRINSDITLKPNVSLVADDPLGAILQAGANNVKILKYTAPAFVNTITVQRLGFFANGFTGVRGISLDGVDGTKRVALVSIEDCYFATCDRAIDIRFCADTRIENPRLNVCNTGIYIDQCADTQIVSGWAQNGSDWAIYILGGAGAFDEGVNITGFTTNGQNKGIRVSGQDWGQIANCSITTTPGGPPLAFLSARAWQVTNSQLAVAGGAPASPGLTTDALCEGIQISNNIFALNTYGIDLLGTQHTITGNRFTANNLNDIRLNATKTTIVGNVCDSTGVAVSILELAGSDYNTIAANTTNGTVTVVGANTKATGVNVVY